MAIIDSGALTFTAIQNEFGGSHPISLSEYYRNGSAVPSNNTNVSESGLIRSGMFYNAVNEIGVAVSSGASTYNVQTAFSSYWNVAVPKRLTINSGVTLGHLTVPASMAGTLIIDHSGAVQGTGGSSSGAAGGTAMTIQSTGVTINMLSGSTISGGAGSGGNGGTGGQGSYISTGGLCCASGNCCTYLVSVYCSCCCNGCAADDGPGNYYRCGNLNVTSGGNGGSFGNGLGYSQSASSGGSGSGGGTSAGTGGAGGNGGSSFGTSGSNGSTGANGNHSNGSSGATGGAAGRAITFSGISAYTTIGTASGTIHGAYT